MRSKLSIVVALWQNVYQTPTIITSLTFDLNIETTLITSLHTHMVKNSGFRYKDTIDEGFGIFQRSDADCILNVGYNTKKKKIKKKREKCILKQ